MALRQAKEKRLADQRQQQKKKAAVDCSNCGVTQSSRPHRAGNRLERRQIEREKGESLRDNKTAEQILANSLNPIEDGSGSRILATVGQLQTLQQIFKSSNKDGSINQTKKVSLGYMGIISQSPDRSGNFEKLDNDKKKGCDGAVFAQHTVGPSSWLVV